MRKWKRLNKADRNRYKKAEIHFDKNTFLERILQTVETIDRLMELQKEKSPEYFKIIKQLSLK